MSLGSLEISTVIGCSFGIVALLLTKPMLGVLKKSANLKILSVKSKLNKLYESEQDKNKQLELCANKNALVDIEVEMILNDAKSKAAEIVRRAELELDLYVEKKIDSTLKRVSSYSLTVIQDLRENSIDIAVNTMYNFVSEYFKKISPQEMNEINKDIRRKLH